jgi:hypothetical protein
MRVHITTFNPFETVLELIAGLAGGTGCLTWRLRRRVTRWANPLCILLVIAFADRVGGQTTRPFLLPLMVGMYALK